MAFGPLPPPPSGDWRSDQDHSDSAADDSGAPDGDATRSLRPAGAPERGDEPAAAGDAPPWQPPGASSAPGSQPPPGSPPTSERPVWADAELPLDQPPSSDGMAIAALVLGILGLLTSIFAFGGVLGLVAVGLGVVGIRRGRQRAIAVAGVVTGALAILVSIAVVFAGVALVRSVDGQAVLEDLEELGGDASGVASDSPCADADDAASFPASLSEGGLAISAVEVCADSFDDFEFGVQVANTSDQPIDAQITVSALDGGTAVSQPAPQPITLPPGVDGWVRIISFDDYAAFDSVDVEASAS